MEEADIRAQLALDEIFAEANNALIRDYREDGVMKVRKLIHASNVLRIEIKAAELALSKKKDQLTKKLGALDQIKAGNWDLLSKIGQNDPDAGER